MANDVLGDEIGHIDNGNGSKTAMRGEHGGQTGKRSGAGQFVFYRWIFKIFL